MNNNILLSAALTASFVIVTPCLAQPAPIGQRVGGILVGDSTLDQIYLTRDMNGDGDGADPGEATVYFDDTNASLLPAPTGSVFTIFQARDRAVYYGDGSSDAVYRLVDLNGDRDAQDAGEATVWFSADGNAGGFDLATPNGVWQADDGAVYILTAGTASTNDAIYRTLDLNGDDDAEDAGEATLWMDTQNLVTNSSGFELLFVGSVAYFSDTVGGDPNAIYRAEDTSGNGSIEAGEFNIFIDQDNPFGVPVATGLVSDGTSLFVSESTVSADQTVYRLTDLNGSNTIDAADEVTEVWSESLVPAGFELGSSFGMTIGPGGDLAISSAGADAADNVFRLVDLNGDGDFLDAGETIVWAAGNGSGVFVDNPRSLEFALPRPGDTNGDDVVDVQDIVAVIVGWGPCPAPPAACPGDLNGDGVVNVTDLVQVVVNWS